MLHTPFYDPEKSYEENFKDGPFGAFAPTFAGGEVGVPTQSGVGTDLMEPQFYFLGFKVNSPFGIAAGPLVNGKFVERAFDKGFDICVYKTVRSRKYPCHPWPNVLSVTVPLGMKLGRDVKRLVPNKKYEEPLSITNSFGVPSFEKEFWQEDIKKVLKNMRSGQILIGAFQGTKIDGQSGEEYIKDFGTVAGLMQETGVQVMEVNLSCPNEGTNSLLCYDTERSLEVVKTIKKEIGATPLIIKIGYFKDESALQNLVQSVGPLVEGISAINTIFTEIVDENGAQVLPGEGRLSSGVGGQAIKWAGLDMVSRLKKLREKFGYKFSIIGVGGVATPEDFLMYRNAGADAVLSVTGAIWNPYLAKEIKERLR